MDQSIFLIASFISVTMSNALLRSSARSDGEAMNTVSTFRIVGAHQLIRIARCWVEYSTGMPALRSLCDNTKRAAPVPVFRGVGGHGCSVFLELGRSEEGALGSPSDFWLGLTVYWSAAE